MNIFSINIFKDIFILNTSKDNNYQNVINTLKNINYLYQKVYKNEKDINEAIIVFGDYIFNTYENITNEMQEFNIIKKYLKLIEIKEQKFLLILETLSKKEKEEVYSLAETIMNIKHNKILDFSLDNQAYELPIPINLTIEENEKIKKILSSYITLVLRKTESIITLIIEHKGYHVLVGILIKDNMWLPLKKDYMQILHTQTLKKVGEKIPSNIKYGEIKKNKK